MIQLAGAWLYSIQAYEFYTCKILWHSIPQSRQSAKRFSSRWNWDSPTPLAAGECAPPCTLWSGGRAHSLAAKGVGGPNSNEGTYTVVLYIYKYFVHSTIFNWIIILLLTHFTVSRISRTWLGIFLTIQENFVIETFFVLHRIWPRLYWGWRVRLLWELWHYEASKKKKIK